MGYEQVLDRCVRSSVELRRIKNAKITAMRHRKWQEIHLEREARERKAAEEYLRRRKRERAQMATYIYSSSQAMGRESSSKSQSSEEYTSKHQPLLVKIRDDFVGVKNQAVPKNNAAEEMMLDVSRLPAVSINEDSSNRLSPKNHTGDKQQGLEATKDFLQEALQERLENEAATSLLIAEVTDMRSRLDDLLSKPLKGLYEGRNRAGLDSKEAEVSCSLCEKLHQEILNNGVGEVTNGSDNQAIRSTDCCMHYHVASPIQPTKRTDCLLQRDCVPGNLKVSNVLTYPNGDGCTDAVASEQDRNITWKQLKRDTEGSSLQQKRNEEMVFLKATICSLKNSVEGESLNQIGLCCCDAREGGNILSRLLQESYEQDADRDLLAANENNMHETTVSTGVFAGCKPLDEHLTQNAKVPVSVSKLTCLPASSDLSPTYKTFSRKQLCLFKECKENISFSIKSRGASTKVLDSEKALLASLERLDIKLAMASANVKNSSRTSLVSAGHQSTKSAPCVTRQKAGSDAYSVNSTMFLSRPTTSQTGGISLISKRRQNVGVTNVSKERVIHLQTRNSQQMKRSPTNFSGNPKDDRRPAAGTIILHQNAEFLFN